jgi:hypothetical protein
MKTTKNHNKPVRMVALLLAAISFGTSAWAQSDADSSAASLDEAYSRLETLMAKIEESSKYVAPSVDDADIEEAMGRLEFFANNTERMIRYEAPLTLPPEYNETFASLEPPTSNIIIEIRFKVRDEEMNLASDEFAFENSREAEIINALTRILQASVLSKEIGKLNVVNY